MTLSTEEKQLISKEIELLESKSSAELVAVVTKRSDNYKYASSILSILFVSFLSLLFVFITSFSTLFLVQVQIFLFISLYFLFNKFDTIILSLLPNFYKKDMAKEYASRQFLNLRLNRTKTNQALMFFVSLDEKYVEIITDKTISSKIPNDYWQKIIDEFIKDIKKNQLSNAYLKAIQGCSEVLIKEFPIQHNDINELSNDLIELG